MSNQIAVSHCDVPYTSAVDVWGLGMVMVLMHDACHGGNAAQSITRARDKRNQDDVTSAVCGSDALMSAARLCLYLDPTRRSQIPEIMHILQ